MENSKQPAFAVSKEMAEISEITEYPYGLTKREYFAAKAMQGMAASAFWSENFTDKEADLQKAMEIAVKSADALLEALNK